MELVLRRSFYNAAFDRRESEPRALRKTHDHNTRGIDKRLPYQKVQRPVCIESQGNRSAAAAGVFDAARAKTVDGERHIAPGCDPLAPICVEPPPMSAASMQQHHSGRRTYAVSQIPCSGIGLASGF